MGSAVGVPTNSCKDKMVLPKVMTYDNAADSVLVEKLHSKAITSTESKLSLLTVLLSPGCLAAFRLFLKDRLSSVEHEFYNTNLEYFHDEYRRSKGKSFMSDLRALILTPFNEYRYHGGKCKWRMVRPAQRLGRNVCGGHAVQALACHGGCQCIVGDELLRY
jgi:hypothetical protein